MGEWRNPRTDSVPRELEITSPKCAVLSPASGLAGICGWGWVIAFRELWLHRFEERVGTGQVTVLTQAMCVQSLQRVRSRWG